MEAKQQKARLALADGTVFEGLAFGAEAKPAGEVVFNTSMTGYQEILTDPSYRGQLVAMTYPEIGNVGVNPEDVESARPFVQGFIVKEYWETAEQLARAPIPRDYLGQRHPRHPGHRHARAGPPHPRARSAGGGRSRPSDLDPDSLVAKGAAGAGSRWARSGEGRHLRRAVRLDRGRLEAGRQATSRSPPQDKPARRRLRLRHQAQHPAQPGGGGMPRAGGAGEHAGGGSTCDAAGRDLPLQWPRRPGRRPVRQEHRARSDRQASRSSASASGTRSSASRLAARRSSSSSVITAAISR